MMERETGFEPATPTLARSCSTTELFPRELFPRHSATWYHGSTLVSPQGLGGVLGRHRVDEEPASPFESRHAGELRDDLEVPVEGLELAVAEGRRVEHEVERGIAQHAVHPPQEVTGKSGEPPQLVRAEFLEGGPVDRRQDPCLEREARRERRQRDEAAGFDDRPPAAAPLLAQDVAPHAALLQLVVAGRARQLLGDHDGNDRRRDQLRMGVPERGAGGLAVVLEHQDVLEAWVLLEVEHAFAEREEHVRHGVDGERRERGRMDRRLDHDLVGAYTVHPVEEPLARRLELPFDPEHGELVGQDPVGPAGPVRAALLAPTSEDLARGLVLVAFAEDALGPDRLHPLGDKIRRPPRALGGDDHPAADDRVLPELGLRYRSSSRRRGRSRSEASASVGALPSKSTAPTSWQMGMLTPWRRASASAEVTVRTPSATMRVRSSTAATVSPFVSAMPSWRLRERLPVHVRTRSPKPASPARVADIAPSATASRVISASPRVMSAARAFSPRPSPSTRDAPVPASATSVVASTPDGISRSGRYQGLRRRVRIPSTTSGSRAHRRTAPALRARWIASAVPQLPPPTIAIIGSVPPASSRAARRFRRAYARSPRGGA